MTKRPLSLTEDRVSRAILRFALPFLIANVLQSLYGAIDLLIIGRYCDSAAISAVATGSQVMMTIQSIIIGVSTGSTVLLGQSIGEQDDEKAARSVGSASVLFAIIAAVLTPLIIIFAVPVLNIMKIPAAAAEHAKYYLSICACGIPFILGYNVISGVFRGIGDSKTPMIFVAISSAVNLIVDIIFVGFLGWGAAGAALATALSQLASFVISFFYIRHKGFPFPFHLRHFKPSGKAMGFILKIGVPLAAQETLVNCSFLIITAMVNGMGVIVSASVGIVEKILGFVMMPPMAFASAVTTMTAQNIGAKKPKRALQSLRWGILYSLIFGVAFCVFALISPETLTGIFSKETDVIKMAATYLRPYSTDCILICIIFTMNSYFNGCGKSLISFAHSMAATFGVRIPLCRLSIKYCVGTLTPMGLCMPAASIVSLIICSIYFIWLRKKGVGQGENENLSA